MMIVGISGLDGKNGGGGRGGVGIGGIGEGGVEMEMGSLELMAGKYSSLELI